jgi:hypothetical protein
MLTRSVRLVRRFFVTFVHTFAGCALVCGCGGGGGGGSPSQLVAPPPSPTPSPAPAPGGALTLSQSSLAFDVAGASATITASEPGYAGTLAADATGCANVAAVSPSATTAPATFTVTAQGGGACTIAFTDVHGQRATVSVGVTVTQGSIK